MTAGPIANSDGAARARPGVHPELERVEVGRQEALVRVVERGRQRQPGDVRVPEDEPEGHRAERAEHEPARIARRGDVRRDRRQRERARTAAIGSTGNAVEREALGVLEQRVDDEERDRRDRRRSAPPSPSGCRARCARAPPASRRPRAPPRVGPASSSSDSASSSRSSSSTPMPDDDGDRDRARRDRRRRGSASGRPASPG